MNENSIVPGWYNLVCFKQHSAYTIFFFSSMNVLWLFSFSKDTCMNLTSIVPGSSILFCIKQYCVYAVFFFTSTSFIWLPFCSNDTFWINKTPILPGFYVLPSLPSTNWTPAYFNAESRSVIVVVFFINIIEAIYKFFVFQELDATNCTKNGRFLLSVNQQHVGLQKKVKVVDEKLGELL